MTTTGELHYYIHDEPDAFRLELSGSLAGDGAQSVYHAWRTALSIVGARTVIVDITYVDEADERGGWLLRQWRAAGARIVAASAGSRAMAEAILGESFPAPPARPRFWSHKWQRWWRGIASAAGFSAGAEDSGAASAPARGSG